LLRYRAGAIPRPRIRAKENHMKDFHCRDVGESCDFVARGNSNKEILDQVAKHAQNDHNMQVTPELKTKVEGLIHDESSDAHRKSIERR
jgi:predicted small metal-binding protein